MLDKEYHRQILFQMLKDIFQSELWKSLAFKGGTACYFLYGLDRFSTDLDFDIVEDTENIDEKIIKIAEKYGTIKKGNKIIVSIWEDQVNIKIDINRKIWKANSYELVDFYGTSMWVQDRASIFANKLVALTERNANRDIYDVYFFFKNYFPINRELIVERTWENEFELFEKILQKLKNLPKNYKILDGLWEVLDQKQKIWVKEKLITELIGMLDFRMMMKNK